MPRNRSTRRSSVFLVEVDQDLGVASGSELVARGDQLVAKVLEVVDLPVHDDGDRSILVEDRLVTAGNIDDREALHPERNFPLAPHPPRVGSAVLDCSAHRLDDCPVDRSAEVDLSHYPAHAGPTADRGGWASDSAAKAESSPGATPPATTVRGVVNLRCKPGTARRGRSRSSRLPTALARARRACAANRRQIHRARVQRTTPPGS